MTDAEQAHADRLRALEQDAAEHHAMMRVIVPIERAITALAAARIWGVER